MKREFIHLFFKTDGKIAVGTSDGGIAVACNKKMVLAIVPFTKRIWLPHRPKQYNEWRSQFLFKLMEKIVVAGFRYPKNGIHDAVLIRYKRTKLIVVLGVNGIDNRFRPATNDYYTSVVIRLMENYYSWRSWRQFSLKFCCGSIHKRKIR